VGDIDSVCQRKGSQRKRLEHGEELGGNEQSVAIQAVHPNSGKRRENKHGRLAGKTNYTQQKRR
jgi:hypothetical protein